jgi:uncharacterized damage-inducible protein DinB
MATTSTRPSETVLKRSWAPDPSGLLELWRHEGPRTLRTFLTFSDDNLSFRPKSAARSIAESFQHIIRGYWLTRHWLSCETPSGMPEIPLPGRVNQAINLLKQGQRELFVTLEGISASDFLVEIAPFGLHESRAVMALGMLKHEIHHRGELYALARVCGLTPPGLYDPIQD